MTAPHLDVFGSLEIRRIRELIAEARPAPAGVGCELYPLLFLLLNGSLAIGDLPTPVARALTIEVDRLRDDLAHVQGAAEPEARGDG